MLNEVLEDSESDVNVETGEYYESVDEMKDVAKSLDCDTVINCTGLGSQTICNDLDVVGGRGILHQYDRENCPRLHNSFFNEAEGIEIEMKHDCVIATEELPWGNEQYPCYMIPRGNIINIGGCYIENDTFTKIRPEEEKLLRKNAFHLGIDTSKVKPINEWVGFRPSRPNVRCEEEKEQDTDGSDGIRVIHNYGHGGSGWTINVGAAKEVVHNILLNQ